MRSSRPRLREIGTDPDYRFSLANERTFLAWIRTSLALAAGGIAVVQLAPDLGPRPIRMVIGVVLIVISGVMSGAAHHRWSEAERAMRTGSTLPPTRLLAVVGYGVTLIVIVVLIALFALEGR